jgi:hypothetical protein
MLSVTYKPFILSAVMMSVIMLNVVAPSIQHQIQLADPFKASSHLTQSKQPLGFTERLKKNLGSD